MVEGCVRVGVNRSGNTDPCPNKFSLRNSDHVAQVLTSANKLCSKEGYGSAYISPMKGDLISCLLDQLNDKPSVQ